MSEKGRRQKSFPEEGQKREMQKYLIRRVLLVIPTLWLVISLLFLGVNLLPGDYVTIKLANLEASGATTQPAEIIGEVEADNTLHRVVAGDTIEIARSAIRRRR